MEEFSLSWCKLNAEAGTGTIMFKFDMKDKRTRGCGDPCRTEEYQEAGKQ
jgi:hypothetical protein